jgi:hypothetical protein
MTTVNMEAIVAQVFAMMELVSIAFPNCSLNVLLTWTAVKDFIVPISFAL